jgi:shikimate kinase
MNLILIGMKACGKSTLALQLAQHLNRASIDTDQLLLEKYQAKSISLLYKNIGDTEFYRQEQLILQDLCCSNTIIATGGSTAFHRENQKILAQLGHIIYLSAPYALIKQRIGNLDYIPAFLNASCTDDTLYPYYLERDLRYSNLANSSIDIQSEDSPQSIMSKCLEILQLK